MYQNNQEKFSCDVCLVTFKTSQQFKDHCNGTDHAKRVILHGKRESDLSRNQIDMLYDQEKVNGRQKGLQKHALRAAKPPPSTFPPNLPNGPFDFPPPDPYFRPDLSPPFLHTPHPSHPPPPFHPFLPSHPTHLSFFPPPPPPYLMRFPRPPFQGYFSSDSEAHATNDLFNLKPVSHAKTSKPHFPSHSLSNQNVSSKDSMLSDHYDTASSFRTSASRTYSSSSSSKGLASGAQQLPQNRGSRTVIDSKALLRKGHGVSNSPSRSSLLPYPQQFHAPDDLPNKPLFSYPPPTCHLPGTLAPLQGAASKPNNESILGEYKPGCVYYPLREGDLRNRIGHNRSNAEEDGQEWKNGDGVDWRGGGWRNDDPVVKKRKQDLGSLEGEERHGEEAHKEHQRRSPGAGRGRYERRDYDWQSGLRRAEEGYEGRRDRRSEERERVQRRKREWDDRRSGERGRGRNEVVPVLMDLCPPDHEWPPHNATHYYRPPEGSRHSMEPREDKRVGREEEEWAEYSDHSRHRSSRRDRDYGMEGYRQESSRRDGARRAEEEEERRSRDWHLRRDREHTGRHYDAHKRQRRYHYHAPNDAYRSNRRLLLGEHYRNDESKNEKLFSNSSEMDKETLVTVALFREALLNVIKESITSKQLEPEESIHLEMQLAREDRRLVQDMQELVDANDTNKLMDIVKVIRSLNPLVARILIREGDVAGVEARNIQPRKATECRHVDEVLLCHIILLVRSHDDRQRQVL